MASNDLKFYGDTDELFHPNKRGGHDRGPAYYRKLADLKLNLPEEI